ncbi:MAG: glycosyltransferase family 2 protein [Labrys sp. (in: a-proteobacteria)]
MTSTALRLESEAAGLLQSGDIAGAFRAADRRLRRRPHPEAHCHVLQAEALHGLGETPAAIVALKRALEERPLDPAANRRLLAWGSAEEKLAAAAALVSVDRHLPILRACVTRLIATRPEGTARITVLHDRVTGWAAWSQTEQAPTVAIRGDFGVIEETLTPDADHSLAAAGRHAAAFDLPRPTSPGPVTALVRSGAHRLAQASGTPNLRPTSIRGAAAPRQTPSRRDVAIIIPIYGDPDTTRACFDSLLPQLPLPGVATVVLVEDASPDDAVVALAEAASASPHVTLLRNERNLGFVGSVNRALSTVQGCDALLLNADTVVPPGFIARLADAAYAAPDIGTVTPLSNNGEIVSHPLIGTVNPLPSPEEIAAIDRRAAQVNAGRLVDIPSGIGFCLYVRHDCLAGIGGRLGEIYHRGYYEDVDLCLTARERGYRNVCATNVFVGHAGTRSFRADKRALVIQNSRIAARRFPDHSPETAAFMAADPLRADRARIERAALAAQGPFALLVAGHRIGSDLARDRGRRLAAGGGPRPLLMTAQPDGSFALACPQDQVQPMHHRVEPGPALEETLAFLRGIGLARIEFLDPARTPLPLARALTALDVPISIVLADAGIAVDAATGAAPDGRKRSLAPRPGWEAILSRAEAVITPDAAAHAFWKRLGVEGPTLQPLRGRTGATAPRPMARDGLLGILPAGRSMQETALIEDLVMALGLRDPAIVLGEPAPAFDLPDALIEATGPIDADELLALIDRLRLKALVLVSTEPVFAQALFDAARSAPVPIAAIDWFGSGRRPRAGDLALPATGSARDWAVAIRRWIAP